MQSNQQVQLIGVADQRARFLVFMTLASYLVAKKRWFINDLLLAMMPISRDLPIFCGQRQTDRLITPCACARGSDQVFKVDLGHDFFMGLQNGT